ncbi:MAG: AAA family ATPase [Eubacteriales bacterium]|nr:AAA family ATPase [Eubacteriales bacterium]
MIFDNIPEELRKLPQWVLWRLTDGKKIPYQPTGVRASTTNKEHYSSYNDVISRHFMGGYSGIGFVFTAEDEYFGIDMDNAVVDGQYTADAIKVLNQFAGKAYAELSQSGKGIHIIAKGKLPKNHKSKVIEMYDKDRYFVFTGKRINGLETITNCQKEIEDVHSWYFDKSTVDTPDLIFGERPEDFDLICDMYQSKSGEKIKKLWAGDISEYNNDHSAADQALCNFLAFWLKKDKEEMDRFFRMSGLCRPKWDEIHNGKDTYGQMTIQKAIDGCRDVYTGKKPRKKQKKKANLLNYSTIEPVNTDFLCYPYIPKGKLGGISGDPNTGKTLVVLKLAEHIATGGYFEDARNPFFGYVLEPKKVLYQTAEDGLADTIALRMEKMGANRKNFLFIDDRENPINFVEDMDLIEEVIRDNNIALAVFDPIQAYLGADVDMHRANEVRPILYRLGNIAEKYGCTIILVMHQSKGSLGNASIYRSLGTIDIPASMRFLLTVVNNPHTEGKAIMHTKSSLAAVGDTILFHIDWENGVIVWDGFSPLKGDNFLVTDRRRTREKPALDEAIAFLEEFLADGAKPRNEIMKAAYSAGITETTIKRAKDIIDVQIDKTKTYPSKTIWKLPEMSTGVNNSIP